MPGVVIQLADTDKAAVDRAAELAGLSVREFCRRAALDAATSYGAGDNLLAMVRAIHKAVCQANGGPVLKGEAADATTALVSMGLTEADARKRAAAIAAGQPGLTAVEIIRLALKPKGA